MRKKVILIPKGQIVWLFVLFLWATQVAAQNAAERTFKQITQDIQTQNIKASFLTFAKRNIGRPYVAHSLELYDAELLIVNLQGFDCYTLVELSLALAHTHQQHGDYVFLKEKIKLLRYREGILDGYSSRLHYFTEWAHHAQTKGFLDNITTQLGGVVYRKSLFFMSKNARLYRQLKDTTQLRKIKYFEEKINNIAKWYIPKNKIENIEAQLQEGDIVAITEQTDGLDVSHEGIVVRKNGRAHLLHASSEAQKVLISPQPLADYLNRHAQQTGIMVFRVRE
jgi:Protein of unknown function (DUF1460)